MDGLNGVISNDGFISTIRDVVGKSAPRLAALFGSPLAGFGLDLLSNVFGIDKSQQQNLTNACEQNPNTLLELQNKYNLLLQHLESNDYAVEVDDRKDARAMRIALPHDLVPTVLAVGILVIFAGMVSYSEIYHQVNEVIFARVQDVVMVVFGFYFGGIHKRHKH